MRNSLKFVQDDGTHIMVLFIKQDGCDVAVFENVDAGKVVGAFGVCVVA